MQWFKDGAHKKSFWLAFIVGLFPVSYMVLSAIFTNGERASDPVAEVIHDYILLPGSIVFLCVSLLSGWLYRLEHFRKPIIYTTLIVIGLCLLGASTIAMLTDVAVSDFLLYSLAFFVVAAPVLLLSSIGLVFLQARLESRSFKAF